MSGREGLLDLMPESLDDLWHLERVVEHGDVVSGKTERKIKPRNAGEKARKVDMHMDIRVEKVDFQEFVAVLRFSGIIVGGKPEELIELKAHHTIDIKPGMRVKIKKKRLKKWQVERIEKARKAGVREKMLAVVLDDEVADFAVVKEFGVDHVAKIAAARAGKRYAGEGQEKKYFDSVLAKAGDLGASKVVFAGPGFTKNNLKKYIGEIGWAEKAGKVQVFFESTNSVSTTGLNELVKSGDLEKIASSLQLGEETRAVEEIFGEMQKDAGLAAYGFDEVGKAAGAGAVESVVVSDATLLGDRERVEALMERVEQTRGVVHIISEKHDAGQRLKGIGGIAAKLRYRVRG